MNSPEQIIKALNLQPHPKEGGFFRESYRSSERLPAHVLPERYSAERSVSTAIYYLLTPGTFSALHRLQSDEIFHFYAGQPVKMLQLHGDGRGAEIILGPDVLAGQRPQVLVPCGVWQGSFLMEGGAYALLGCTVAPGFEYADYEHGNRAELLTQYPAYTELITRLTVE